MQKDYSNQPVEFAGFWVRLAAYCLDSLIVFAGLLVVRLLMSGTMSLLSGTALGGNILFHYSLKDIVLYIFQVMYFILCTYLTGTTPGKKAMNLRVISAEDTERLTLLNVVYRETVGRFLCSLSIGIGYLIAGIDKEKRGIHDMLCDTRVIYAKKIKVYPVYQAAPVPPVPPAGWVPPQENAPVHPGPMQGNLPPMPPTEQENRRDS